jgi:predicted nucleic acid-binding protein
MESDMKNSIQFRDWEGFPVVLDVSTIKIARRTKNRGENIPLLYLVLGGGSEDYIEMASDGDLLEVLEKIRRKKETQTFVNHSVDEEVFSIAVNEGKMQSIKRYREIVNCSLRDAKDYVEEMVPRRGGKFA